MVARNPPPPAYDHHGDSDDDSIPPPPPPMDGADEGFEDHEISSTLSRQSSTKPTKKWRFLNKEPEHALIPQDEQHEGAEAGADFVGLQPHSNNNVPMQGHFRGIHNAQEFDEEEAGMDEIEVPSSSVVARLNEFEKKERKKKRFCKFGILALVGLAVFIAIVSGSVVGSKGKGAPVTSEGNGGDNGNGGGDNGDNGGGDNGGDNGGGGDNGNGPTATAATAAAKTFIMNNPNIPQSTKTQLTDENSSAYEALDWIVNDPVNNAFNFDDEATFTSDEAKLKFEQRFAAACIGLEFDAAGWMTEADVCEWAGITCAARRRKLAEGDDVSVNAVTELRLPEMKLYGSIPAAVGLFPELTHLLLNANFISGPIPAEVYQLSNLKWLDLYDNLLTGEISSDVSNLSSITGLYLGSNKFSGQIPAEIQAMVSLQDIWLDRNKFTGPIPDLGNLIVLKELFLEDNDLTGGLPESLATAPLQYLNLDNNANLFQTATDSGFPMFLLTVDTLVSISMQNVGLAGTIPGKNEIVDVTWPNLTNWHLDSNLLTGNLALAIGYLPQLTEFTLSNNVEITGKVPWSLGDIPTLELVDLSNCGFVGALDPNLGNMLNLKKLYLSENDLTGDIPTEMGQLLNLETFEFDLNNIVSVPGEVCDIGITKLLGGCDVTCDCCADVCL